jgi:hypothetical protein
MLCLLFSPEVVGDVFLGKVELTFTGMQDVISLKTEFLLVLYNGTMSNV